MINEVISNMSSHKTGGVKGSSVKKGGFLKRINFLILMLSITLPVLLIVAIPLAFPIGMYYVYANAMDNKRKRKLQYLIIQKLYENES